MNWIKENTYVIVMGCLSLVLSFMLLFEKEVEVVEIEVVSGDSLWTLAQEYGAKDTQQWIEVVMKENELIDSTIRAGEPLRIPATIIHSEQLGRELAKK